MAGFFALRRETFRRASRLSPLGYKIGLELIVKCGIERVAEVPIHFANRRHGSSKLTLRQQWLYLKHLRRLYVHRFTTWTSLAQFLAVGGTGVVVNLGVLTLLLAFGAEEWAALASGIVVSVASNFLLNRRFTFPGAMRGPIIKQSIMFVGASAIGGLINFLVAIGVTRTLPELPIQLSAIVGIAAGTAFNFLANRYVVFRNRYIVNRYDHIS